MKKSILVCVAMFCSVVLLNAGLFDDLVNAAVQEAGKAAKESVKQAVKESVKESVEEAVYVEDETPDTSDSKSPDSKPVKKTAKNESKSIIDPKKDIIDINQTGFKSANEFVKKIADRTKELEWMNIEFGASTITSDKGGVSVGSYFSKDKKDFFSNAYSMNPGNMLHYKVSKKEGGITTCFVQYPIVLMIMSSEKNKKNYDRVEKAIKDILPKCEPCSNYANSIFGE
jgi:hypothetical protein